MADKTHIEYADATWNPITGCSVVSPGCTNCYAMRYAGTRGKHLESRKGLTTMEKTGPVWNGQVRFNDAALDQPLRWRKPRVIFPCAHGDLFHESVPFEWIDKVFAVMALAPQHIFIPLTKRAGRMREYLTFIRGRICGDELGAYECIYNAMGKLGEAGMTEPHPFRKAFPNGMPWPLPNVWPGFSAEDQPRFDERWQDVDPLARAGWLTWCSAEPLLGPIDASAALMPGSCMACGGTGETAGHYFADDGMGSCDACGGTSEDPDNIGLAWMIAGGESAQNKPGRPMHPDWPRALRDQCQAAEVAFTFKQWGDHAPPDVPVAGLSRLVHVWADGRSCAYGDLGRPGYARERGDGHITMARIGKRHAGRHLDGRTWDEMPKGAGR